MSTVFLSYVESDKWYVDKLTRWLDSAGCKVSSSQDSDPTFYARDHADYILVIWSESSVNSPSVYEDALIAKELYRLVQVTTDPSLEVGSEFTSEYLHILSADQTEEILRAVGHHSGMDDRIRNDEPMAAIGAYHNGEPTPLTSEENAEWERQREER